VSDRPYDVVIVGELNADILVTGDVVPEFGQVEKLVDDLSIVAGSSSGIFAAGAARLGLRVLLASRVGDDLLGHYMVDELRAAGVDTTYVTVDAGLKTGATVLLSRGQDRAMLTYLGSIAAVSARDLPAGWTGLARHLHVASPFLLTGLRPDLPAIMSMARRRGMTVSLDTNWDPSGRWEVGDLLEHTDVLLPNEQELVALSGVGEPAEALEAMVKRVPLVAVKRGGEGATVARGELGGSLERISLPALAVQVVDTTGAGDTFDAGFLAGWLRGAPLAECLALGAVCGGLTCRCSGGFNGQPTWEEALTAARQHLADSGLGPEASSVIPPTRAPS